MAFSSIITIGLFLVGSMAKSQDECSCAQDRMPVCGNDGNTYANQCTLCCAYKKRNPILGLSKNGECDGIIFGNVCFCTREHRPVCGSNGETYSNDCTRLCAAQNDPCILLQHRGECTAGPQEAVERVFVGKKVFVHKEYSPSLMLNFIHN